MLELWLGVDYVTRQVPVEQESRDALRHATASSTIPALVIEDGSTIVGEDAIRIHLDLYVAEPPEAEAHQRKAAKARHRYLEEE